MATLSIFLAAAALLPLARKERWWVWLSIGLCSGFGFASLMLKLTGK